VCESEFGSYWLINLLQRPLVIKVEEEEEEEGGEAPVGRHLTAHSFISSIYCWKSVCVCVCVCVRLVIMTANMCMNICLYVCIWSLWVCRHVIGLVALSPNSLQLPLNPPYFSLCESLERQSESYCFNHAVEKLSDRWIERKRQKEKERKRDTQYHLSIFLPITQVLYHKPWNLFFLTSNSHIALQRWRAYAALISGM